MAKADLKKLSDAKLKALLADLNEQRDALVATIRGVTGILRAREVHAKVRAELDKLPVEQRKAILATSAD